MTIARGVRVAALGHGTLRRGVAALTMRELGRLRRGAWTTTLVLERPHARAQTIRLPLGLR